MLEDLSTLRLRDGLALVSLTVFMTALFVWSVALA